MKLSIVFGFITIVVLFQFVYADVKPLTIPEIEKSSDVQLKPDSILGEKLIRPRRTLKKGYGGGGYGGGCLQCGGGYVQPQVQSCPTCGGYGGGYGGRSQSWSNSQASAGSVGYGKK